MEEIVNEQAKHIVGLLGSVSPTARLLVAIAGVPASGKSSLAIRLVQKANALLDEAGAEDRAILVGLDGWHMTRAELDAMENPQEAHDRRGIHWTFDAKSYASFVELLRKPLDEHAQIITAPTFDHALKDPCPDAVSIHPHHRIVVIEGLYTMLNYHPWDNAAERMDQRWWVQIDKKRAKARLVERHVQTGIAKDMDEAVWRAENNDEKNGDFIAKNQYNVTYTIQSIDDPAYTPSGI
ncbi:hypothetical protein HYDPIDRAFT_177386 [Hydnomerulius pinastri MD-312]|uniref:Unplaced genomic scaffold scaffold_37, whole genome shotgun sequence n=1 Tax=Hydnomerulius pinastri MD-312 TaxID=994086 RepID=A0A0C9WAK3_9AGAM|nr:hypothetical protein HYDPIDRAFT_177386 [Hydnomerulius pinastri MD-312]